MAGGTSELGFMKIAGWGIRVNLPGGRLETQIAFYGLLGGHDSRRAVKKIMAT